MSNVKSLEYLVGFRTATDCPTLDDFTVMLIFEHPRTGASRETLIDKRHPQFMNMEYRMKPVITAHNDRRGKC